MNFPLILLTLTIVTGAFWIGEVFYWKKRREADAVEALRLFDAEHSLDNPDDPAVKDARKVAEFKAKKQPVWLEWTAGIFPVILVVFLIRSFVVEPFRIPSGSMLPTLEPGDFIVVNKYEYGLRFPVINTKLTEGSKPRTGDVIVFDHPLDPGTDLIKRIVGIPGDKVVYSHKILYINGVEQKRELVGDYVDQESLATLTESVETLGGRDHRSLTDKRARDAVYPGRRTTHPGAINYTREGFETVVPEGHYLVLGDNRDNSDDGRYWGFVPEDNIVGRAFFIWLNISDFSRIGSFK